MSTLGDIVIAVAIGLGLGAAVLEWWTGDEYVSPLVQTQEAL